MSVKVRGDKGMICEHCQQRNATVTVTQVVNGQNTEHHYCEICATQFYPFNLDFKQEPVKLHQLLSNFFGIPAGSQASGEVEKKTIQQQVACPKCGFTYQRFLKDGKLGCAHCYETFSQQLPHIFKRLQAGTKHVGKQPGQVSSAIAIQKRIDEIRLAMQTAIAEERFEDAAVMRDEVRELELKLQGVGGERDAY